MPALCDGRISARSMLTLFWHACNSSCYITSNASPYYATKVISGNREILILGNEEKHKFWWNNVFIAPLLKIRFSVPVKRDETAIFNPRGETLKVGLQTALSSRFTGTCIKIPTSQCPDKCNVIEFSMENKSMTETNKRCACAVCRDNCGRLGILSASKVVLTMK